MPRATSPRSHCTTTPNTSIKMTRGASSSRGRGRQGRQAPRDERDRSAVESHYDNQANVQVPRTTYLAQRKAGPLIKYKDFANNVKRRMYKAYAHHAGCLLDLGCGRGGEGRARSEPWRSTTRRNGTPRPRSTRGWAFSSSEDHHRPPRLPRPRPPRHPPQSISKQAASSSS